jgi:hypothetical protein
MLFDVGVGRSVGFAIRRKWLAAGYGLMFARWRETGRGLLVLVLLMLWWKFADRILFGNR